MAKFPGLLLNATYKDLIVIVGTSSIMVLRRKRACPLHLPHLSLPRSDHDRLPRTVATYVDQAYLAGELERGHKARQARGAPSCQALDILASVRLHNVHTFCNSHHA